MQQDATNILKYSKKCLTIDEEDQKLLNEIKEIFAPHPDASKFIWDYTHYVHLIDDMVDEVKDKERILEAQSLAREVFSNPFYHAHKIKLSIVEELINNDYADSVDWEMTEDWRKQHADVLRHAGYHMFFAVVLIIAGRDALRKISARFREYSHKVHLNDIICHL